MLGASSGWAASKRGVGLVLVVTAAFGACTETVEGTTTETVTRTVTATASTFGLPAPTRADLQACAKAADVAEHAYDFIVQPEVRKAIRLVMTSNPRDASRFTTLALRLFTTLRKFDGDLTLSRSDTRTCLSRLEAAGIFP